MILLSVQQLVKHYGPEPVLAGASFEVRPGERIGLVGPNGTGKTTLMKILAGQLQADSGQLDIHSTARIAYLEQQPQFEADRTVWDEAESALAPLLDLAKQAEEVAHELAAAAPDQRDRIAKRYDSLHHEIEQRGGYHLHHRIEQVLDGLGFARQSYRQPVQSLSGGQQSRLLLAKLLLSDSQLLLLDEPSNHLDIDATAWLEGYLCETDRAMLVVSHDRYLLDKVTNRTLELFHGTIDSYTGNFSAYWRQKAERLEVERRTYEKQQETIAKTEEFIRRNMAGQKSAQAKDREKKLARIERVDPPRAIQTPAFSFPPCERSGDIVLRVEHLGKAFDRPLFDDLNWDLLRGQRWGILGPNGSGKTTLLRCLVNQEKPTSGQVIRGARVALGYFDQLLTMLADDLPVVEAVRPPGVELNEPGRRDLLARFGITGDMVFQRVSSLSGGERNRAALARLAGTQANLLVLDEPTNHLDLWARDALERALLEFDGTVVFVSHDRYFLNRVADHLLVLEPGRGVRVIEGNYETYLHLTRVQSSGDSSAAKPAAKESPSRPAEREKKSAGPRKWKYPYRKVADIEDEIFEQEEQLAALQAQLGDPEVFTSGERTRQVNQEIADVREALRKLYEHWEEANERGS